MICLVKEIQDELQIPLQSIPEVFCTVFKDNSGAVELSKVPKMRPRTKHINVKYHHFRQYVFDGTITIQQVISSKQLADIFTKNLPIEKILRFRLGICGW